MSILQKGDETSFTRQILDVCVLKSLGTSPRIVDNVGQLLDRRLYPESSRHFPVEFGKKIVGACFMSCKWLPNLAPSLRPNTKKLTAHQRSPRSEEHTSELQSLRH